MIPADFLVAAEPTRADPAAHRMLVASALAQSAALAFGRAAPDGEPYRAFAGDRPSTTILYRRLDPASLGALIALFEHKVAIQAAIWGINAFDQFGVELGKSLTNDVMSAMDRNDFAGLDASTVGLAKTILDRSS